jgi:hypothetical protein
MATSFWVKQSLGIGQYLLEDAILSRKIALPSLKEE